MDKHKPLYKLRALRAEHGLTQAKMAKIIGISEPTYCQKEIGKREFTLKECKIISDYFGKPIEYIFFNNEVNTNKTNTA